VDILTKAMSRRVRQPSTILTIELRMRAVIFLLADSQSRAAGKLMLY
jgi:hypothetical protein